MVGLMACSLFAMCVLNFSNISKLDYQLRTINENQIDAMENIEKVEDSAWQKNKCKVCEIEKFFKKFQVEQKKMCDVNLLVLKNEVLKINLSVNDLEQKLINAIKNKHSVESGKQYIDGEEIRDKLENLLPIIELVYDYSAMNENSRVNDNYNYYNLVKNEVISYFNSKINLLIAEKSLQQSTKK